MNEENEISKQPRIVKSHDIHIDMDYAEWIAELKHRYRSAQVKASIRVNSGYMKRWYLFYNQADTKLYQLGKEKLQQPVEEF